jgi:hypothetical protein
MRAWQWAMVLVAGALLLTARPAQAQRVWVGPSGPVMVAPTWQPAPVVWQPAPVWYGSPGWVTPRPNWYRGGWYGGYRGGWYASARGPRGRRVGFYRRW